MSPIPRFWASSRDESADRGPPALNPLGLASDTVGMPQPALRLERGPRTLTRLDQELALQPRLLASVEVLQLGGVELREFLAEKALSNEALELDTTGWRPAEAVAAEGAPRGSKAARIDAGEAHWRRLHEQPDRLERLDEALHAQVRALDASAGEQAWLGYLIEHLDAAGTLTASDESLLAGASLRGLPGGAAALGAAIARLQSFEPCGVGGRCAVEAMLLQLDPDDGDYRWLACLLEDHLADLASNKWPKVARQLGVTTEEVARLVRRMQGLRPRPADGWGGPAVPVVAPDLKLRPAETGGFTLSVERGAWPEVHIDPQVQAWAQDDQLSQQDRRYLRGKLEEARWLVEAVEHRQVTLLRVANAVFQAQPGFLERGSSAWQPLSMQTIAERLQLAVSTVSRAVAGKWVDTPHGLIRLRDAFQSQAGSTSSAGLRERVQALVQAEDPRQPLSDDALTAALAAEGHRVARRTVAKYRKELGIKSSYQRVAHA